MNAWFDPSGSTPRARGTRIDAVADRRDIALYMAVRRRAGPRVEGAGWERLEYDPTPTADLNRDASHCHLVFVCRRFEARS